MNDAAPSAGDDAPVDPREMGRLKWGCRRGLLENDLLIERFFARHGALLTRGQARNLQILMDLADNDLLDLLLSRTRPGDDLSQPGMLELIALLKPAPTTARMLHPSTDPTPTAALRNS